MDEAEDEDEDEDEDVNKEDDEYKVGSLEDGNNVEVLFLSQ